MTTPPAPALGRDGAPVPTVIADEWRSGDPAALFDPGPAWPVPAGAVAGLVLVAASVWIGLSTNAVAVPATVLVVGAWLVGAGVSRTARTDNIAYGVATAAWVWGAWAVGRQAGSVLLWAFFAAGLVGQLVAVESRRRASRRCRDVVRTAVARGRTAPARVGLTSGPPWSPRIVLVAADESGRTWTGESRPTWRERPVVGQPAAVWLDDDGAAVIAHVASR